MKFKKLTESFNTGYKAGDRVELANGQTAVVARDYSITDDYLVVDVEGTDERKYPLVDTVRPIHELRTESLTEAAFDDDYIWPIGSNTLTAYGAKKRLGELRNDLKIMLNCDTLADVQAHADEFTMYNCANIVERYVEKGMSEEDAIEKMQTQLMRTWNKWKEDVAHLKANADNAYATFNKIKDALTQYELIEANEDACILKYKPVEGATHKDCIEFVDAVVAAVNGRYNFTGRGGSWTRWDILTNDGVALKAGWDHDGDIWSVSFPRLKFESKLTETYWIDNKNIMSEVDRLGKELEADGFKYYGDRYSGSTYYNFFTKRGDNGAICKAVQYNYDGAQIIDVTVDQLMGYEPIDSFEQLRRKLGNILLPKNEDVADGKEEDQFVLYFPYLEPKVINKERAIKQIEFELNNIKNDSGASLAGRGFGIYCLKSIDADTGTAWTGRYSSKEFLDVLHEDVKNESFEMAAGGDDFDGEIAAMRQEQADLERRRAARKERFALMHKLFDAHMDAEPDASWVDKVYHIFDTAESTTFIGSKYGTIPGRTEDKQPIRYRFSIKEYDFYTDPYWEVVYIGTNNVDPLKEDLEDDFDLYMKASDFKCKLSRYDVEEAANPDELIIYMEDVYSILSDEYGAENIKWWKFYEDDDVDFGYKVCLKDGSKHIVEINNDKVDEVNEALEERKTQYVICGVTNDGTRMLYDAVNDNFTTDYDSATKYDDMDVARDDWFKIPRSGFRRIFIPVYDPAVFESLNEGTGADTAHTASNALKIAAQGDKHKWAKTASEIIDVIPDEFADQMFDAVKEKAADIKLSAENKKKLVDASNGELTDKDVEDCDTLGKILALVDGFEWAEKNPGLLKGYIMVVLSIVAIIEPTPVLEIITLIVGFLPAEWVAKVLAVTNVVGNPLGAAGTIANKAYKHIKSKKDEAFDADKVQKRIACTAEFDNGHVFHNDYFRASSAEAEERAKQASLENPDKVFYVKYDDVMNPSSDIKWKNGEQLNEAEDEEPIYFDPDDEFEVDFRYYVYANNDDVVSDAFDFEEDAIAWAQENNYPIVKIHNYYRDVDGQLNPDGDPEVIWEA